MAGGRVIGIDLGTTYSCAAISEKGVPTVIKSNLGYATIPSIVTFDDRDQAVVGQLAERRMVLEPENTIYGSKRLLGRAYSSAAVKTFQPQFRYKLVSDEEGFIAAEVFGKTIPLVEISAMILKEMRRASERILNERVSKSVITVPAYFNENQRNLVRKAASIAEMDVIRIINEPTAAALAFGGGGSGEERQRLLIFDLGGGTFDVSIVEVGGAVYTVLGVGGNTFLGGIDVDRRLADLVIKRLSAGIRKEIELDAINSERLREAAQKSKHQLSVQKTTIMQISGLKLTDGTSIDVNEKVTRDELEEATVELRRETFSVVEEVLKNANLRTSEIDEVLLVGGQTRMPVLHAGLKEMFGFEPSKRVHPDEVVALGAAIAAESSSRIDAPVLLDVVPMPIGLAGPRGIFQPVIRRNTPVPHEAKARVTVRPGTGKLRLAVFQGLNENVATNEYLGTLIVDGLDAIEEPVECEIKFILDSESILKVHALIPTLGINWEAKLITSTTPDQVLAEMNSERIQVKVPAAGMARAKPRRREVDDGSAPLINLEERIRDSEPHRAPRRGAQKNINNKPRKTAPEALSLDPLIDDKPQTAPARVKPRKTAPAAASVPIEVEEPPRPTHVLPTQGYRMVQKEQNWFGRLIDWIRGR